MSSTDAGDRYRCEDCGATYENPPVGVNGPTCSHCGSTLGRGGGSHPTVTVKWWAMGGLRAGEVELADIESVEVSPTPGGKNPFQIRLAGAVMPQYCFAIEWPENASIPNTGSDRSEGEA